MRLFIAIELDKAIRDALAVLQAGLDRSCSGVRWIPSAQVHLTLRFLGEVPDAKVPAVSTAVSKAAAQINPFAFELGDCGCFPRRGPVRIVWAGVREPSGSLVECAETTSFELELIGFEPEQRPFSAHVTIGRVRDDRSGGSVRKSVEGGRLEPFEQSVDSLTLFQSVLSSKGPTYTVVSRSALGAASSKQ